MRTVYIRRVDGPVIDSHYRDEVCRWLKSNNLDPGDVPAEQGAILYAFGFARITLIARDEDGCRIIEENGFKRTRRWVRVSRPPPADEGITYADRVAIETDAMRERIEG